MTKNCGLSVFSLKIFKLTLLEIFLIFETKNIILIQYITLPHKRSLSEQTCSCFIVFSNTLIDLFIKGHYMVIDIAELPRNIFPLLATFTYLGLFFARTFNNLQRWYELRHGAHWGWTGLIARLVWSLG